MRQVSNAAPSPSGFSLAGALVALAISGIAFSVLGQYLSVTQAATGGVQNNLDFQILKGSIAQVLGNSDQCANAFKGATFYDGRGIVFTKFQPSKIQAILSERSNEGEGQGEGLYLGNSLVTFNGQDLGAGLTVTTLELKAFGPELPSGFVPVELRVEVSKNPGAQMGPQKLNNFKNPFRFSVQLDGQNQIVACSSSTNPVAPTVVNPPSAPNLPNPNPDTLVQNFQTQCAEGANPYTRPLCCRLSRTSGEVHCKLAAIYLTDGWVSLTNQPFTTAVETGNWSLSLVPPTPAINFHGVCRTNHDTGATHCVEATGWNFPSWRVIPSPFN
jgi:hypothetical protein